MKMTTLRDTESQILRDCANQREINYVKLWETKAGILFNFLI